MVTMQFINQIKEAKGPKTPGGDSDFVHLQQGWIFVPKVWNLSLGKKNSSLTQTTKSSFFLQFFSFFTANISIRIFSKLSIKSNTKNQWNNKKYLPILEKVSQNYFTLQENLSLNSQISKPFPWAPKEIKTNIHPCFQDIYQ